MEHVERLALGHLSKHRAAPRRTQLQIADRDALGSSTSQTRRQRERERLQPRPCPFACRYDSTQLDALGLPTTACGRHARRAPPPPSPACVRRAGPPSAWRRPRPSISRTCPMRSTGRSSVRAPLAAPRGRARAAGGASTVAASDASRAPRSETHRARLRHGPVGDVQRGDGDHHHGRRQVRHERCDPRRPDGAAASFGVCFACRCVES